MNVRPIGIIHSPFKTKDDCPIQPLYAEKARGTIEVRPEFAAGLKDIEGFSHIHLIYWLDRAGEVKLVRPTFLDDREHGVFASRHPCRPNPLGLSIVRLTGRRGNVLEVEGIDVLDQTPLLDIKPYVPTFDRIDGAAEGWMAGLDWRPKPKGRE